MSIQIAIIAILLIATIIIFFGLKRIFSGDDTMDERLNIYAALPDIQKKQGPGRTSTWIKSLRIRLNSTLSIFFSDDMVTQLVSANWPITPTEYVLTRLGITAVCFLIGWVISSSIFGGLGLAVVGYIIPAIILKHNITKRGIDSIY